jgi:hypothetical protein
MRNCNQMNLEQRMRAIAAGLSGTARIFVPPALIALLIDICKSLDQLHQDKKP